MTAIETDRLRLRPFRDEDLDAYAALCADPEVMRYVGDRGVLSRDEAWRQMAMLVGHWQLRGFGMWAVEERSSGAFVGRVGLHYPEGWPDREVAWALARAFWGRGFAFEAARLALSEAFGRYGWDRVISLIDPANIRSVRLAERLGERPDGENACARPSSCDLCFVSSCVETCLTVGLPDHDGHRGRFEER